MHVRRGLGERLPDARFLRVGPSEGCLASMVCVPRCQPPTATCWAGNCEEKGVCRPSSARVPRAAARCRSLPAGRVTHTRALKCTSRST